MGAYLVRRLALTLFVIWGAVSIMFIAIRLVPGDPALVLLGTSATPEQVAQLRAKLGLDQSMLVQYWRFLESVVRFDFGDSIRLGGSAMGHVLERLPRTVGLGATAMTLALVVSFPLGIAAARHRGRPLDATISVGSLIGQALPTFWVGIMLILIFARFLKLLPSGGSVSVRHLVLPAITLALPLLGSLVRLIRSGLLDEMGQPYIQTARSKGLTERTVTYGHAVRNTLLPVVTIAGLQAGELLSGVVIVEVVFAWPGLGRLLVDALFYRDYPIVQAAMILVAAIYALANLVVDLLYARLDPRVRLVGVAS